MLSDSSATAAPPAEAGSKRPSSSTSRLRVALGAASPHPPASLRSPPTASAALSAIPVLHLAPEELSEAAEAASASHADDSPLLAPRSARYKMRRVRDEFQLTVPQFAQMLHGAEHVTQAHVNRWEGGFERVPHAVDAKLEKLHDGLLRKLAQQPAAEEAAMVLVQPEYPNQEPMLGADYQATVPKQGGGGKEKKEPRGDVCTWSIRACSKEGVDVEAYLNEVHETLRDVDSLEFDEVAALTVLHELRYNQRSALDSLRLCVAWEEGDWAQVQALPRQSSAILWLERLRTAALDSKKRWTAGQREALDAGCQRYGKELADVHKHVLQELPYPKFIQLYYQCSHLPRPPDSP
ncbi:hypothetical protein AB1Y20_022827 [Prymnesium parvum]|uniref:ELM2 domain-containing protein n=1 Tax=Prymnesium parvum TaxID=97485 RepID=A0AB34JBA3_PRYPA